MHLAMTHTHNYRHRMVSIESCCTKHLKLYMYKLSKQMHVNAVGEALAFYVCCLILIRTPKWKLVSSTASMHPVPSHFKIMGNNKESPNMSFHSVFSCEEDSNDIAN